MRPTRANSLRWACLAVALTLAVPRAGFAEEPLTAKAPAETLSWETGEGHSYFIPALEIAGFIAGLNVFNRFLVDLAGVIVIREWRRFNLTYNFLGHTRFGAVEWRPAELAAR